MVVLWYLIKIVFVGLIVGGIARLLYPGRENLNLFRTILLGIGGSLLANLISYLISPETADPVALGGWIASIVGALVLIFVGKKLKFL